MRELTLLRTNPAVAKAKTLNTHLSKMGFDHSRPIHVSEFTDDGGALRLLYTQHENEPTHVEVAQVELIKLDPVQQRSFLGRLKFVLTGR